MKFSIALISGDGIGPEVTAWAVAALEKSVRSSGCSFDFIPLKAGGAAIDETGSPLPLETLETAKQCGAVLLGAMGGPKWDKGQVRPEQGLLALRSGLGVFANLRPAALLPPLRSACPLKPEISGAGGAAGFDMLIVRELTGGIYFGAHGRERIARDGGETETAAFDTERYSSGEIERILRVGYSCAGSRRKKLCIVDKANVLESSRLWREVGERVSKDYPDIETSYLYVDNAAMQLIRAPVQFDVIVTSNLFGDILSDEASVLTGSIGMLPSASLAGVPRSGGADGGTGGAHILGLYEPIHGSAPDIAGQDSANPLAAILSAAMALRYSFNMEKEARAIEAAVTAVLDAGLRTKDIASRDGDSGNERIVGTKEMGEAVLAALE
ncbi:MAG: 3-isopropylmalate dehydrogenase [Spirochaetaceae bacterium]|jgi:3-isopropylmalate dehydrogenase|nr:3-isopropylmalate dehydrogenase [Spirochaetaceae bacterium]